MKNEANFDLTKLIVDYFGKSIDSFSSNERRLFENLMGNLKHSFDSQRSFYEACLSNLYDDLARNDITPEYRKWCQDEIANLKDKLENCHERFVDTTIQETEKAQSHHRKTLLSVGLCAASFYACYLDSRFHMHGSLQKSVCRSATKYLLNS